MNEHEQRLLESVLAGEIERTDPDLLAALAANPELDAKLDRMLRLQGQLDDLAADQHSGLALAAPGDAPAGPGDEESIRLLRSLLERGEAPSTFGPGRLIRIAATLAAAVVLVALGRWMLQESDPGPDERETVLLDGPGTPTELRPQGPVARFGTFTWSGKLPAGDHWRLVFYDASGGFVPEPFLVIEELEANSWTPDPAATDRWPTRIRWEVRRFAADGVTASASSEALCWLEP